MNDRAEEQQPLFEPRLMKCPRCGLVSEGLRCERCNAPKITPCTGSCSMCGLSTCENPEEKKE